MAELRVSTTGVARRTGHGAAVLLKIYAHCIDGAGVTGFRNPAR
jgi:hypothetical protein